ncbi:MAG: vitamin K epoxide reductase family protein [Nitrospira sp.]|nr:vitamin K epoxide reductase family protein [Nitrospira sp.]
MAKHRKRQKAGSAGGLQHAPPTRAPAPNAPLTLVLLTLSVLGIVLTTYLSYTALFEAHPAFCGEGSGCDLVQSSRWAAFLGMPMATWGLFTYLALAALAWRVRTKSKNWTPLIFVAVGGFGISAYLTVISIVEIEATCTYCLASFGTITAIMILTLVQRPSDWATSLKEASVVAVLIVGGLHLHYSGVFDEAAGPEDPQLQALAVHLTETGAKFYGAYWCPRCQEQKALFKASAKRLPYVECSSGGRGSPLTAPCAANNIRSYPTWIIDDKRHTGLQTPRTLAGAAGFTWKE